MGHRRPSYTFNNNTSSDDTHVASSKFIKILLNKYYDNAVQFYDRKKKWFLIIFNTHDFRFRVKRKMQRLNNDGIFMCLVSFWAEIQEEIQMFRPVYL